MIAAGGDPCADAVEQDLGTPVVDPMFRLVFLFHADLDVFDRAFPRCVDALTRGSAERFEVVVHSDGTPVEVGRQLIDRAAQWDVDEVRIRRRARYLASGDRSNNGHRRLFDTRSRYLIVVEDDVVMYRGEESFDVLAACRRLFERYPDVPVLCKVDDSDMWAWKLRDVGPVVEPGVRSVNRVATHFIVYDLQRFLPVAERFGGFELDVFIDRDDLSYNWEDLVSHVGTTGGRRIAFPDGWPLRVFHCDRKVEPDSMYHTQDPRVKHAVLDELEARFGSSTPAEGSE